MGYIRKKICSFPGCQNAVVGEGAYCDKHKKKHVETRQANMPDITKRRGGERRERIFC